LWSDEFPPGSLQQVLLAVGYREVSLFIDHSDISGLEPAIHECVPGFLRTVPIGAEHGRSPHQDFGIMRDPDVDVGEGAAHSAQPMSPRVVHCYDGRSFSKTIAFVDADAQARIPRRQFLT